MDYFNNFFHQPRLCCFSFLLPCFLNQPQMDSGILLVQTLDATANRWSKISDCTVSYTTRCIEFVATTTGWRKVLRGSWPLFVAAIVLALLNAFTLTVRGTPWGITSAFSLWGGKFLNTVGIDVASWGYFTGQNGEALKNSVLADYTSVLNFGIILGAFIAASFQGTFKPKKIKPGIAGASILGGLLMGYGSRLAFGCNIGAYFGGISSFSLHGWVWAIMALLGTFLPILYSPVIRS